MDYLYTFRFQLTYKLDPGKAEGVRVCVIIVMHCNREDVCACSHGRYPLVEHTVYASFVDIYVVLTVNFTKFCPLTTGTLNLQDGWPQFTPTPCVVPTRTPVTFHPAEGCTVPVSVPEAVAACS